MGCGLAKNVAKDPYIYKEKNEKDTSPKADQKN